jgi:hypothetical protein
MKLMKIENAALVASLALMTASCAGWSNQGRGPLPRYEGLTCENFKRNSDGSWSPVRTVTIVGPNGPFSVVPGQKFRFQIQETTNYNVKIAETLDDNCR